MTIRPLIWTVVAALSLTSSARAYEPLDLLVDVPHGPTGSVGNGVQVGNLWFFSASSAPNTGTELWRTDGTPGGTLVLTESMTPGPDGIAITELTAAAGTLFFVVDSFELWKSDGTAAGTTLVRTIAPPGFGFGIDGLIAIGDTVFFRADDGVDSLGLWKSDGTAAGTIKLKGGGFPVPMAAAGGSLFFNRSDTNGRELWKSDGTAAGTVMVKNIQPGSGSGLALDSAPKVAVMGEIIYFAADDGAAGTELWRSDGTDAGTTLVADIVPGAGGSSPAPLAAAGGTLFVAALTAGGSELWRSDGTAPGTAFVKGFDGYPGNAAVIGPLLYFGGTESSTGTELWVSDGTTAGTAMVKDIAPGTASSNPSALIDVNGQVVFRAAENLDGTLLWTSDGTTAGTIPLTTASIIHAVFDVATGSTDTLLFSSGPDDNFSSSDLWKTDGTAGGTALVKNVGGAGGMPSGIGAGEPADAVELGSILITNALGGIWRSDGTPVGTTDTGLGSGGSFVRLGTVAIYGETNASGGRLLATDGTGGGTSVLIDTADPYDSFFGLVGSGSLVYAINGRFPPPETLESPSYELWRTDGTPAGTFRLRDNSFFSFTAPVELIDVGGTLFFRRGLGSTELWKSDGSVAGTVLVKNMPAGVFSGPYSLVSHGGDLYFLHLDGTNGQLWRSNGTTAGTVLVTNFGYYPSGYSPTELKSVGSSLFFPASSLSAGEELWVSDGTAGGTMMVADIAPGATGSKPQDIVDVDGIALFLANDGSAGFELWRSDGTAAGTFLVRDIKPGPASSFVDIEFDLINPLRFFSTGPYLYFGADDGVSGRELWRSDGTSAGTIQIADLASGPYSSRPSAFALAGGSLFLQAGQERDFYRLANAVTCGDGVLDAGEACDDGNLDNTDGCNAACQPSGCGDGFTAGSEACDDGNAVDTDACPSTCTLPVCGDGFAETNVEGCDDGNAVDGDGCDTNCLETACGNDIVTSGEDCDTGANNGIGTCSATCTLCGNGTVSGSEECDDGNGVDIDGCTNRCTVCGDSTVAAGETCDDGNLTSNDGCDANCTTTRCGNGVVAGAETCDDGNRFGGDCCSAGCGFDAPGASCASDGNDCTADTCDGAGTCGHAPTSGSCDDGIFCNGADTCSGGLCTQHAGDPCSAGSECADNCNEMADMCFEPSGTLCTDDGNSCTDDQCNGAGACAHPARTGSCDDGLFCNGADTCSSGVCLHTGDPCAGGIACVDTCDEADDNCLAEVGSPCTDPADVCAHGLCDGAGTCDAALVPAETCLEAQKSSLALKHITATPDKDKFKLKWTNGPSFWFDATGDPRDADGYTVCVYDATGLVWRAEVPAGGICSGNPCWTLKSTKYDYKDKLAANDGVSRVSLRPSFEPKTKALVIGKGTNLPDPVLPLTGPITAQIFRDTGPLCLSGTWTGAQVLKNDGVEVKAKAKAP